MNNTREYRLISSFYGDRKAKRSECRLMDHIDQGLAMIRRIGGDEFWQRVWCMHPLMQNDEYYWVYLNNSVADPVWKMAAEYRAIANAYLPKHGSRIPQLSSVDKINWLLLIDKTHNLEQFEATCRAKPGIYANEHRLREYFNEWIFELNRQGFQMPKGNIRWIRNGNCPCFQV